jgi:hypothetical protein
MATGHSFYDANDLDVDNATVQTPAPSGRPQSDKGVSDV